jgi:hypothetical protein
MRFYTVTTIEEKANLGTFALFKSEVSIGFWIDERKIFSTKSLLLLEFQSNGDRQMVLSSTTKVGM